MKKPGFVETELQKKAELYTRNNAIYKDNYKRFGPMVQAMMGVTVLVTPDDYNRMGILTMLWSKLGRYSSTFSEGGHDDSLDDLSVYAMMLKELDAEARGRRK